MLTKEMCNIVNVTCENIFNNKATCDNKQLVRLVMTRYHQMTTIVYCRQNFMCLNVQNIQAEYMKNIEMNTANDRSRVHALVATKIVISEPLGP